MENLIDLLQREATEVVRQLVGTDAPPAVVTRSTKETFGHYQCNAALQLAQTFGKKPREIAQDIVAKWPSSPAIERLEIAGPGFINITLKKEYLSKQLTVAVRDPRLGVPRPQEVKKIIVEFSSPNVAKELHVGHLRSTIIGESLARLFEFLGHDVLRLNHIGDWGTQFGMLIAYLKEFEGEVLVGATQTDLSSLMHWYRASKKLFDESSDFKKRAQAQVVRLQGGEKEALQAWEKICAISRKGFQEIYDFLDVTLIERGESYYNAMLPQIVGKYEKQGIVQVSDGAKCVFLEGFETKEGNPLPMILQKSDGGYNYSTTDSAALYQRIFEEKADRIIYVADAGQQLHFQMMFAAAQQAGYYSPDRVQAEHVPFGVVLGADGKKFKTRSGATEKLIDLLREAVSRARALLEERLEQVSAEELDALAQILGLDAVKYADLSCHRLKDYLFSYDRMLNFEGNTAPYLLYSYVRIQGIKRKCNKDVAALIKNVPIELRHPTEIALGLHLRQFGEILEMMDRDLLPNRLSDYLYVLAEKFHAFFRDCRVLGDSDEEKRLVLAELTGRILQQGLSLLGLKTMGRM